MPDKNLIVLLDDTVSEIQATITRNKKVTFFPADSEQKVTIEFTDRVPFSDWGTTSRQTGDRGKPVKGKVLSLASGHYPYKADSAPGSTASAVVVNPELIVDGGNIGPRRRTRSTKKVKRSRARKKR